MPEKKIQPAKDGFDKNIIQYFDNLVKKLNVAELSENL